MTVPQLVSGPSGSAIIYTILDEMMLIRNGTLPTPAANSPYTIMAINLNASKGAMGDVLWRKDYDPPAVTRSFPGKLVDTVNRVFIAYDKEVSQLLGFSLDSGDQLWATSLPPDSSDFILYSYLGAIGMQTAYGLVYFGGYGGIMHAFNTKDGKLVWTYGNGGPGNTTYSGTGLAYGRYPIYPGPIANGILYLDTGEHSAQPPLYKDALVRALNATTGEEIWTLTGWGGHHRREGFAVADGFLTFLNHYDMRIYSIGRGPSATTVAGPEDVQPLGKQVLIKGMVTDIAAGTTQEEQAARFPLGVPAVSDESMKAWMEYVYMQKPRPANATGVEVTLAVLDSNNNYYEIGKATSDTNGMYSLLWEPPVPGKYTVYATFAGSEGYWPSHAETAIGVEEAPIQTPAPTQPPAPMTDTYVTGFGIAIIVVLIAGIVVIVLVLRRR
jgi:hypothetical protein